jgi:hypothetical protein
VKGLRIFPPLTVRKGSFKKASDNPANRMFRLTSEVQKTEVTELRRKQLERYFGKYKISYSPERGTKEVE